MKKEEIIEEISDYMLGETDAILDLSEMLAIGLSEELNCKYENDVTNEGKTMANTYIVYRGIK